MGKKKGTYIKSMKNLHERINNKKEEIEARGRRGCDIEKKRGERRKK